jgi:hypothetical protein
MTLDALTTREWASVIWVTVIVVAGLATPFVRDALAPSARMLLRLWSLHLAVLALLGWVVVVCYVGSKVGDWNWNLAKDTATWVVVSGCASIFAALQAGKEEHFFRRSVLATLSVAGVMQFLMGMETFSLWVELLLQLVVFILVVVGSFAGRQPETRPVQVFFYAVLLLIWLWVVVGTVRALLGSWDEIDVEQAALTLAFSFWFPLAMLPFVYVLGLVLAYDSVFRRLAIHNNFRDPPRRVKVAMLVGLHGDLRAVNDLPSRVAHYAPIAQSDTFREALQNVEAYKAAREESHREEEAEAARLTELAGVKGTDEDGRLLDQREVNETRSALRWLHTCQMGWHNNEERYRRDLLDIVGSLERRGLPREHGITLRVSKSGQSWYAWRRLPIGHVLGIGANGPTPNEWLYDAKHPPKGYPGHDASWGDRPFEAPPNWR